MTDFSFQRDSLDINQYIKWTKIKEGGFSTVYSVEDKNTHNQYAAKIINKPNYEMINQEINILKDICHPSIVKYIGYSMKDSNNENCPIIFTKYAKKDSLLDLFNSMRRGSGPDEINVHIQTILIGIACGMKHLHDRNIIHCDLKLDNILLDGENEDDLFPFITDFGLSKKLKMGQTFIPFENEFGTLQYMAPELLRHEPYGKKIDVYSFGILMYEILTNSFPYPDLVNKLITEDEFKTKVINGYRPRFNVPIKKSLQNLIEKCLFDDPEKRPSFEEIYDKLANDKDYFIDDVSKDELEDYIILISNTNIQLEDMIFKNKNLQSIINNINNENKKLNDDKSFLNQQICKLEEENNELRKKIKKLTIKVNNLTNSKDHIKNKYKLLKTENEENLLHISELNLLVNSKDNKIYNKLINENEKLKKENKTLNTNINILNCVIHNLKRENENYKDDRNLFNININNLYVEMKKLRDEKKELIKRNNDLKMKNDQITTENIKINEENKQLKTKIQELNNKCLFIQQFIPNDIIKNSANKDIRQFVNNVKELMLYLIQFKEQKNNQLLEIVKIDDNNSKAKRYGIRILSETTKILFKNKLLQSDEFIQLIKNFDDVIIQINDNSHSIQSIYNNALNIKKQFSPHKNCKIELLMIEPNDENKYLSHVKKYDSVILDPSIKEIKKSYFKKSQIQQVTLPSSISSIESSAFSGCSFLTHISIPFSVTKIKKYAFKSCTSLKSIFIPSSVIDIGKYAFQNCSSLVQVIISSSLIEIKPFTFGGCSSLNDISIPFSCQIIGKCAFNQCTSLKKINISTVTEIGPYAFNECIELENVLISMCLKQIDKYAFNGCKMLKEFLIPSSLIKIGEGAFCSCEKLNGISIPKTITEIEDFTFSKCYSLTKMFIPLSVTKIGSNAFNECVSLNYVEIPSSVKTFGYDIFKGCESLENMSLPLSITETNEEQ